jgi:hypothetical protein
MLLKQAGQNHVRSLETFSLFIEMLCLSKMHAQVEEFVEECRARILSRKRRVLTSAFFASLQTAYELANGKPFAVWHESISNTPGKKRASTDQPRCIYKVSRT